MQDGPELPTFYQRLSTTYNVLPDDAPMTWGIWDLDGWLGEIRLDDSQWRWRAAPGHELSRAHDTWQGAVDDLIRGRPDGTS